MTELFKYSRLEYATTLNDYEHKYVKNGDKILVIIFGKDYIYVNKQKYRWHYLRICKVVKKGPVMFKNINNFWCINCDMIKFLDGNVHNRINNTSFLTYCNNIVINQPLSSNLDNFICSDMICYNVRIPNDDLLEEIRQYKKKDSMSLFRLAFLAILNSNLLLHEYNYLKSNYCIGGTKCSP